jgi:hypothetical protein
MSSQTAKKNTEVNKDIIDKLQAMGDLYGKTNGIKRHLFQIHHLLSVIDKWRAYSYQKAITTIRRCTQRIDSYEVKHNGERLLFNISSL